MRVCRCSFRRLLPSFRCSRLPFFYRLNLIHQTFCYNHDDSIDLRIDTILQPLFSLTDRLAKYLGRVFICLFVVIISTVVYIFYSSIFIHLYDAIGTQHNYFSFLGHVLVAHWLLVNILFNYVQCVRVDPGSSPNFGYSQPYDFDKGERDRMKIHQAKIDKNNNSSKTNEVTIVHLSNDGRSFIHTQIHH